MQQRRFSRIIAIAIIGSMMLTEGTYLKVDAAEPALQAEAGTELRLSVDRLEIEIGEIYQLEVESKTGEIQDDWKIEEVTFTQPDVLKVVSRDEIPDGTTVKKYTEQKEVIFKITDQIEVKPTQFFVVALKSGTTEIEVVISGAAGNVFTLKCASESLPKGAKAARDQARETRLQQEEAVNIGGNTADSNSGENTGNIEASTVPASGISTAASPADSSNTSDVPDISDSSDSAVSPGAPGISHTPPASDQDNANGATTPEKPDGSKKPDNPANPEKPDNPADPEKPDSPTDPEKPDSPADPEKPPVNQEDNEIADWIDQDSTSLTYNGKIQMPTFSKLPEGYTIEGLTGNTNAGTYTEEIIVKDANGKIVKTAAVNYEICPSVIEIKHLYDAENGVVLTDISGLIESDVVNIEGAGTTDISKAGRYQIATDIEINEEKIANYILADGQTSVGKTDAYNVVGNNPWFEVLMDYSISDDNSQLTVNFYLKNLRTEQVGATADRSFILDLCIYYDEDLLTYAEKYNQYNDWRVDTVNPNGHKQTYVPDISSGPISVAPDLTVYYTGRCHVLTGNGTTTKMCSLTYNIKDSNIEALTNSVITIDQVNYDAFYSLTDPADENDIPARYWADPTSIVLNPDGSIEEHDIVAAIDPVENNLTPSQSVYSPAEFEEIKNDLRDYMAENMTETKDVTPSDPLPADNTAIAATSRLAADTESAETPGDGAADETLSEENGTDIVQEHTAVNAVTENAQEHISAVSTGIENAEASENAENFQVNEESIDGNTTAAEPAGEF